MKLGLLYVRTKSYDQGHTLGPNGVAYLASYVEEKLGLKDTYIEFYYDKLIEQKPDIVGISSVSETYPLAVKIAEEVKKELPQTKVIIGGAHITAVPETLHTSMDVGVISEGEEQFGEVIELILNNQLDPDHLQNIKGICYRDENNRVRETGKREWIKNIDRLPPPKREAIAKIHLSNTDFPLHQSLMTNRGCPFKCSFCSAVALWESTRYHSLERVMLEIEDIIRNYPQQKMIPITDDLFALHKKRLRQMIDMMRSEKLLGKAEYTCHARASCFDEETASLLAEMGVKVACFGFESGNDRVLRYLKGGSKASDNQRSIDLCNKYGISVLGNFIVAPPTETIEELGDTYWFIRRNKGKIWRSNVCVSTPFPGTAFWNDSVEKGLIKEGFNQWEILDLNFDPQKTIYMNDQYSKEEFTKIFPLFLETNVHATVSKQTYVLNTMQEEYLKMQYQNLAQQIKGKARILEISNQKQNLTEFLPATAEITKIGFKNGKPELPVAKYVYDYIVMPFSLEKLRAPRQVLQEIRPLLRESGELILINYNMRFISLFYDLVINNWQTASAGIHQKENLSFFSIKELQQLLRSLNYSNLNLQTFEQDVTELAAVYNNLLSLFGKYIKLENYMQDSNISTFVISCSPNHQKKDISKNLFESVLAGV